MANEGAGGPRWLDVAPDRLGRWLGSFADRHGGLAEPPEAGDVVMTVRAADGSAAECHVPFPPLAAAGPGPRPAGVTGVAARIAAHARADRTVGVFLVRLGGYAAGVFTGPDQQLAASKVGSRLVHGRSAAGGQSQHRFARRREKQASEALAAAADTAARVLVPYLGRLDALVLGGDKRAMSGMSADPRLRPLLDLATDRFLTVPDPRLAVLRATPPMYLAVQIRLTETGPGITSRA
jgi:Actinobacteria/chloroflexi VLRF1 release factor